MLVLAAAGNSSISMEVAGAIPKEQEQKLPENEQLVLKEEKTLRELREEEKKFEAELGLTSGKKTPYNIWLEITNEENKPYKILVNNTFTNLVKTIEPKQPKSLLLQFEGISDTLSVLSVGFAEDLTLLNWVKRNPRLYLNLTAYRYKNPDVPAYLTLQLRSRDSYFNKTLYYDETENNYVVNIKLEGDNLQRTTISVQPATQKHLVEIKEAEAKRDTLIKNLQRTGSRLLPKMIPQ